MSHIVGRRNSDVDDWGSRQTKTSELKIPTSPSYQVKERYQVTMNDSSHSIHMVGTKAPISSRLAAGQRPTRQENPEILPIVAKKKEILKAIRESLVTIIVGETGSGKTTQIPQFVIDDKELKQLLAPDCNQKVRICVTQPRRIAASAMARRVALERNVFLGKDVGYSVRFDDCVSTDTVIEYCTDGIALRKILETGGFARYHVLMIDEAHERSLHTDILFALVRKAFGHRSSELPSFRVIVASATLDAQKFSSFFHMAPIITITGRQFEVDVIYNTRDQNEKQFLPHDKKQRRPQILTPSPASLVDASVNAALNIHRLVAEQKDLGHILVFLTGRGECESACSLAMKRLEDLVEAGKEVGDAVILPLYGALDFEDQALVFEPAPEGCRKIIFATNVAETSLTVEGVEFVVDCGFVKQKMCNPRTGVETLTVVSVAKSQAIQRAGRAGRVRKGICYRLYSEDDFDEFPDSPELEIKRANLSSVVLQLKSLGLNDILSIQFIDSPSKDAILMSLKQLFLLGALDHDGVLTEVGKKMVSLPLDPIYARCLLAGCKFKVDEDVAAIVAMLSAENVWSRPFRIDRDRRVQINNTAERRHALFYHKTGDHITLLNVFRSYNRVPQMQRQKWCQQNFLLMRSLSHANDIYQQLLTLMSSRYRPMNVQTPQEDASDHHRCRKKVKVNGLYGSGEVRRRMSSNRITEARDVEQDGRLRDRPGSPTRTGYRTVKYRERENSYEKDTGHKVQLWERSETVFERDTSNRKEELILRSLCEGCFINCAKVVSGAVSGSVWDTDRRDEDEVRRNVWVSLKDGLLFRCDRYSSLQASQQLEERSRRTSCVPEFVIFNEITATDGTHRRLCDPIGTMRIVSEIKEEWISHLIPQFTQVDMRSLMRTRQGSSICDESPGESAPFKVQIVKDPFETPLIMSDVSVTKEAEDKIDAAKERYQARRRAATLHGGNL